MHASGSFDVQVTPQAQDQAEGTMLGRMSLDKQFHGDLVGTGKGEMLTAGTFVLLHNGAMTRDSQQLTITVVPDSGTSQLAGLAGNLTITIVDGKHLYDFEYSLGSGH